MENDRASEPRSAWIDRAERLLSEQGRDRRFGGIRVAAARLLGTAAVLVTVIVSGCGGDDGDDSATPPPPPPPATTAPTPPPSGEGTTLENPADAGGDLEFQKVR